MRVWFAMPRRQILVTFCLALSFFLLLLDSVGAFVRHPTTKPTSISRSYYYKQTHKTFNSVMTARALQATDQQSTAATTESVPNWRVLDCLTKENGNDDNTDEIRSVLRQRGVWSEEQYQDALELYEKFISCTDNYVTPGIHDALNTLDHAYRLYGAESVINSFNGGKDAVVILQLVRAAHAHYYRKIRQQQQEQEEGKTDAVTMVRPRAIYFEHKDEFPEVLVSCTVV